MDEEDHELVFVDAAKKRRSGIRKCGDYFGVSVACFLLVAATGLAVALAVVVTRHQAGESCPVSMCRTESCMGLARTVADNMDTSFDPCTDFYSFSCGGWVQKNPIPDGRSRYSPFDQLDQRNKEALIRILEESKDDDIEAVQKLRTLYRLCVNESQLEILGAQPLIHLIHLTIGDWPLLTESSSSGSGESSGSGSSGSPLNTKGFLQTKLYGSSAFFSLYVYVDDKNSSRYTIFLEQSGLTLPSPENYDASDDLYYAFMNYTVKVLSLVYPSVPKEVYLTVAENIFELEKKLASVFVPAADLRDPEATYNSMTIEQLSKTFPGPFHWNFILKNTFTLGGAPSPMPNEPVIVRTPTFFSNLSQVLAEVDNQTLVDYVAWQLIQGYVQYLSKDFLSAYHNFTLAVYGSGSHSRNETCLAMVQSAMAIALARPYTEYVLPGGMKENVDDMISAVKTAFKQRVNSSTWLDPFTKEKCNEKVDDISQRVAYPSLIYHDSYLNTLYENYTYENISAGLLLAMASKNSLDYSRDLERLHTEVDKTEWDIAPTAVNAYYNPSFNQFTFLEGILAPPFISSDWPRYFTYGAFGTVIGHELTHGFDHQGQQYDAQGDLRVWWDNTSTTKFKDRKKCFVEQYSRYEIFGHRVNGNLTLGENLADNGGLKTSYQAYKNTVAMEGTQSNLPGLDYTPDQLFFIAFAQLWCSHFTPEYITTSLLTNPHSPGPFRVNGTLVNSQEFADTFKCSRGSPMNPNDKCLMW